MSTQTSSLQNTNAPQISPQQTLTQTDPRYDIQYSSSPEEIHKTLAEIYSAISQSNEQRTKLLSDISPKVENPKGKEYENEKALYEKMQKTHKFIRTATDPGSLVSKISPSLSLPLSMFYNTYMLLPAKYGKNVGFLKGVSQKIAEFNLGNKASPNLINELSNQIYSNITTGILTYYALGKTTGVMNDLTDIRKSLKEFGYENIPKREHAYQAFKIAYSTLSLPLNIAMSLMGTGLFLKYLPFTSAIGNLFTNTLGNALISASSNLTRLVNPFSLMKPLSSIGPFAHLTSALSGAAAHVPFIGSALSSIISSPGVLPFSLFMLGYVGSSIVRQLAFRKYKPKNVDAYQLEQQTSASQSLQPFLIKAVTTDKSVKTLDVLQLQVLMMIEAHASIIPLIYNLLHSEKETKRTSVDYAAEKEYTNVTELATRNLPWFVPIRKKLTELQFRINPLTQLVTFLTTGMTPKKFIEDVIYGEEKRIKEIKKHSEILGISESATSLLGKASSSLISGASTFESKIIMLVSGIYDLLRQAVLELITIRKLGFNIESSYNVQLSEDIEKTSILGALGSFALKVTKFGIGNIKLLTSLMKNDKEAVNKILKEQKELIKEAEKIPGLNAIINQVKTLTSLAELYTNKTLTKSIAKSLASIFTIDTQKYLQNLNLDISLAKQPQKQGIFDKATKFLDIITKILTKILVYNIRQFNVLAEILKTQNLSNQYFNALFKCLCCNVECEKLNDVNLKDTGKKSPKIYVGTNELGVIHEYKIPRFKEGGKVAGKDTGKDTVLALLRPGEYVLRKEAVERVGEKTVEFINNQPDTFLKVLSSIKSMITEKKQEQKTQVESMAKRMTEVKEKKKEEEEKKFKKGLFEKIDVIIKFFEKFVKSSEKEDKKKKDDEGFSILGMFAPLLGVTKFIGKIGSLAFSKILGRKTIEKVAGAFLKIQTKIFTEGITSVIKKWFTGKYGFELIKSIIPKDVYSSIFKFITPKMGLGIGTVLTELLFGEGEHKIENAIGAGIGAIAGGTIGSAVMPFGGTFLGSIIGAEIGKRVIPIIIDKITSITFDDIKNFALSVLSLIPKALGLLLKGAEFGVEKIKQLIFGDKPSILEYIGGGIGILLGIPFGPIGMIFAGKLGALVVKKVVDAITSIGSKIKEFTVGIYDKIHSFIFGDKDESSSSDGINEIIFGEDKPGILTYAGAGIGALIGFGILGPFGAIFGGVLGAKVFPTFLEKLKNIGSVLINYASKGIENIKSLFIESIKQSKIISLIVDTIISPIKFIFGGIIDKIKSAITSIIEWGGKLIKHLPFGDKLYQKFMSFFGIRKTEQSENVQQKIETKTEKSSFSIFNTIGKVFTPIKKVASKILGKSSEQSEKLQSIKVISESEKSKFNVSQITPSWKLVYVTPKEQKLEKEITNKKSDITNINYLYDLQKNYQSKKTNITPSWKLIYISPKEQKLKENEYKNTTNLYSNFSLKHTDINNISSNISSKHLKSAAEKSIVAFSDKFKNYIDKLKTQKLLKYSTIAHSTYSSIVDKLSNQKQVLKQTTHAISDTLSSTIKGIKETVYKTIESKKSTAEKQTTKEEKLKEEKEHKEKQVININTQQQQTDKLDLISIFDKKTKAMLHELFDNALVKTENFIHENIFFNSSSF